jgi:predicted transcriptional regulator
MATMTVRLPRSVHTQIQKLAKRDGVSMNQFLVVAAAEKMSAMLAKEWLSAEAAQGSRADFEAVMNAVPAAPIPESDMLPKRSRKPRASAARAL